MSEQLHILEMVQKGQIGPTEGLLRLEKLGMAGGERPASRRRYKFLKVRVSSENQTVNVNATVPIRLLSAIGGFAGKVASYVSPEVRAQLEAKGIDLADIDYGKIIKEVINGTLDDPSILEVEAWDESHQTTVKVRIYVE